MDGWVSEFDGLGFDGWMDGCFYEQNNFSMVLLIFRVGRWMDGWIS